MVRSILVIFLVAGTVGCESGGDTPAAANVAGCGSGKDTPATDRANDRSRVAGCGSGENTTAADTAAEGGSKTLSWDAVPDSSVWGYKAYWGTSSQRYNTHVDVGANTSYTVTGLQHGTTYFFAVSAYNGSGESGLSAEVSSLVD